MPYALESNEEQFFIDTPNRGSGKHLACILRTPKRLLDDNKRYDISSTTRRCAILMHGNNSHKNFCCAVQLSRSLAEELGMYSLRFDFRNCGDSTLNGNKGRTVEEDIQDVEAVYEYLTQGGYHNIKFHVEAIVGHSRGVVDMFEWALKYNYEHYVPSLIACAGRFIGEKHIQGVRKGFPDLEEKGGHMQPSIIRGKYTEIFIPLSETNNLGHRSMEKIKDINSSVDTMCIYGSNDDVIPLSDSALYANALSPRNKLVILDGLNHQYRTVKHFSKEEAAKCEHPYHERTHSLDYNQDVADIIVKFLGHQDSRGRFYERNLNIHKFLPRWKKIEGVANFRDIGGYKSSIQGKHVKYNHMYRSADLSGATDRGKEELKKLGIKVIFDLRFAEERSEKKIDEIEGIKNINVPLLGDKSPMLIDKMNVYSRLLSNYYSFVDVYKHILDHSAEPLRIIFTYIKDHPSEPFLFHCAVGKDRTGILGALILSLLGVSAQIICREYEQTEYGLACVRKDIERKMVASFEEQGPDFEAALNQKLANGRQNWTLRRQGLDNLLSSRYEVMLTALDYLKEHYGGAEKYLEEEVGLKREDLESIRENLLVN
ncbi:hypothetical protein HII12_005032 [Brettanomyces bruxellensis]|uniref:DEBR0S3_00782g1_1 n=1 Tax=Dekkera bruxellensis TaxID=5007 RepID=A0A7D9CX81_DEKBR|nr:hypothetical protein HII12_005032 [Brettanomyces bruxellensis]VUG18037.1 DEBR0S3_00782g1_1 [Brettanomyces bruxellensis]